MKRGGSCHRLWRRWTDWYIEIGGREIALPDWPWRIYCAVHGHDVTNDHCGQPEHRYCTTCRAATPGASLSYVPVGG